MKLSHPGWPGSVRLAPAWHQTSYRITFRSAHQHDLFSGGTDTTPTMPNPLIVYQNRHSNPLFARIFSFLVPTWCQS